MDPVARLRAIATALPGVTEKLSHGEVAFFCGKQFVMVDDHHHGADHLAFWCAAPPGAQEELVGSDPERYFRPPYVGHRGWVGVRIDAVEGREPDWDEVAEVVREAYRRVAPARAVARLDADTRPTGR